MDWPVTYVRKVRYSDTDAQGIVFNANYARYFDDTLTDYFEAAGYSWGEVEVVLARMEIDFRSASRLGETLITGARVDRIGKSSMTIRLLTWERDSERPVAEGKQVQVVVAAADFSPVPVPDELVAAIKKLQGSIP